MPRPTCSSTSATRIRACAKCRFAMADGGVGYDAITPLANSAGTVLLSYSCTMSQQNYGWSCRNVRLDVPTIMQFFEVLQAFWHLYDVLPLSIAGAGICIYISTSIRTSEVDSTLGKYWCQHHAARRRDICNGSETGAAH